MPDRLILLALPTLRGEHVVLRRRRESDIDDRVAEPIDPDEEDAYGSTWRREWDGRRFHAREHVAARFLADERDAYTWAVEFEGRCIGGTGLRVNVDQHRAAFWIGLFVPGLRGRGLGKEITRLVLDWAFGELGLHRVELEVLASNTRAIRCYLACGFRQEGVRREAELYPDGWQDFIEMAVLRSEHQSARYRRPDQAAASQSNTCSNK
jgi:[ribosomal protein S5]-alanine N-acetyltransferase